MRVCILHSKMLHNCAKATMVLRFAKKRVVFLCSKNKQNFGCTKFRRKSFFFCRKKKHELIKSRIGYNQNFSFYFKFIFIGCILHSKICCNCIAFYFVKCKLLALRTIGHSSACNTIGAYFAMQNAPVLFCFF